MVKLSGHFRDLADWSSTNPAQLVDMHLTKCPNTARGYREDLQALASWMEVKRLGEAAHRLIDAGRAGAKRLMMAWVEKMRREKLSANTIRRRVASVKSLLSAASDPDIEIIPWQIGRLPNLPAAVRVRDCQGPDQATVERMFIGCRERFDAKGARDEALLGLLYWHALRASEVLSIRMADVDLEAGTVRIVAKCGQGRMTLKLCRRAIDVIERWLERRGDDNGLLFSRCQRYGKKVMTTPLSYWGLRGMVRDLGVRAGGRCWPHAMRHAASSHLASLTYDSPLWGCALTRHQDVRAWSKYQDRVVSHVSAAEILSRGQRVSHNPQDADK